MHVSVGWQTKEKIVKNYAPVINIFIEWKFCCFMSRGINIFELSFGWKIPKEYDVVCGVTIE